ncbi:nucleotidyltransferase domain-containing protein [Aquisalibacillus elongatus]|uniref:Nucleotidyltransferase-like protein n=1 Tax=Aquisalibacillus elongatus TaxID=485577 RepID=A0A3N5B0M3_9BACI|nr:nucleotidyltransferase domain-containing protein [Aquisalibacillus elongatus]RPF50709.1 nucleotidyltransferase-like protein [Aquisalibacillus elongatus]
MRLLPENASMKFVNEKFPTCDIALLAGSASRGEDTETSDLDIVIIEDSQRSYRESFILYGWKIEAFIHNYNSYLKQFEIDRSKARPILANMILYSKVLKDNGKLSDIRLMAKEFIENGPPPLSDEFIKASRYFIYDLLDDFVDSKNDEEALLTLNNISLQLSDFILRLNGQWSGRGKGLARALKEFDEKLYYQFFDVLNSYYKFGKKQPFIDFVYDIYKPLGGALFDGYKQNI